MIHQATKHSFGAEQYWEWARIFSRLAHTDVDNGLSDLIVPFLDIGKEGELQGQIKSINRDLEIMHRITNEQKDVVEKLEKAIQHLARGTVPDVEPLLIEIRNNVESIEDMRRSADDISGSVSTAPCQVSGESIVANNVLVGLSHLSQAAASHRGAGVAIHAARRGQSASKHHPSRVHCSHSGVCAFHYLCHVTRLPILISSSFPCRLFPVFSA